MSDGTIPERIRWWQDARFGMFIHWGLFSVHGMGVWHEFLAHVRKAEHAKLADEFNPRHYRPREWVAVAQDAGMRYMVLTTRNHDGYCAFDSKTTDFTSVRSAAQRDLVAEYAEACHAMGVRMGFYYSLLDWRFPGSTRDSIRGPDEMYAAMVEQAHEQVRELMSNYGTVDILWYDGMKPWDPVLWRSAELNGMARRLQPGIIINNRAGLPEDFGTPEQTITPESRPWEACYTTNGMWGYCPADTTWKTPREILGLLITCVSQGGNLILNVGPDRDGLFPREAVERLRVVGAWMKANGRAIYGATASPYYGREVGWSTQRGCTVYVLAARWHGPETVIGWCGNRVLAARLLATGEEVWFEQEGDRVCLSDLPRHAPDPYVTVIELDVEGEPRRSDPE